MTRSFLLTISLLIAINAMALTGCGDSTQAKTPGISGSIQYTGSKTGGIVTLISSKPRGSESYQRINGIAACDGSSCNFSWPKVGAGTWYIWAYFVEGVPVQSGTHYSGDAEPSPQPNEPLVNCSAITIGDGDSVSANIILMDADANRQPDNERGVIKSCS